MSEIEAVVSDFGGVLTTPLADAFAAFGERHEVPLEALGGALAEIERADGENPLFALETGRMSEPDFVARLGEAVTERLGRPVDLRGFSEAYFAHLHPNGELIGLMADLRARGYRMAILTNNVREWEPLWRAMLPVDDIFELVVDSGFVGIRKPDPAIYELTLRRLGIDAPRTLFVDDTEINVRAARELGMQAVHFRANGQAIAEIEAALAAHARP